MGRGGLRDAAITAEHVAREVRELARRWDIGAGGALVVHFAVAPGLYAPAPLPPQSIAAFGVSSRDRGAQPPVLGDVDRIRMSEILRDLAALAD